MLKTTVPTINLTSANVEIMHRGFRWADAISKWDNDILLQFVTTIYGDHAEAYLKEKAAILSRNFEDFRFGLDGENTRKLNCTMLTYTPNQWRWMQENEEKTNA